VSYQRLRQLRYIVSPKFSMGI